MIEVVERPTCDNCCEPLGDDPCQVVLPGGIVQWCQACSVEYVSSLEPGWVEFVTTGKDEPS